MVTLFRILENSRHVSGFPTGSPEVKVHACSLGFPSAAIQKPQFEWESRKTPIWAFFVKNLYNWRQKSGRIYFYLTLISCFGEHLHSCIDCRWSGFTLYLQLCKWAQSLHRLTWVDMHLFACLQDCFFYQAYSSCLKLSYGRCSSLQVCSSSWCVGGNNSTWSFKKSNEQRMKSVCWELSIILAIRSVAFSRGKYNLLLPLLAS